MESQEDRALTVASATELCRRISGHAGALAALELAPPDFPQSWRRLATVGALDVQPIAQINPPQLLGLRAAPGVAAAARPVVLVDLPSGEQMLLAASQATLVPIWITLGLVNAPAADWAGWQEAARSLEVDALHVALGGTDDLAPLRTLLYDQKTQEALCADLDGELWSDRLPEAFAAAAPCDPRGRFQRTIDDLAANGWGDATIGHDSFGPWSSPGALLAAAHARPSRPEDRVPYLTAAARRPAGHDAAWLDRTGLPDGIGMARRDNGAPTLIARTLAKLGPPAATDPLLTAVRAHAAAGSGYDGRAHLDAIRPLLDRGDREGAWNGALTAAFWTFHRRGAVPAEIMLMVGKLAQEIDEDRLWPVTAEQLRAMGAEL